MLVKTEGIVLRQTKFQDTDKILTIFSRKNGKIQAIAKGARKPKSSLISSTQVFCYSDFILYKGRNFYHINQGEVIDTFYSLREDLNKLAYATYLIELVDSGITEEESNEKIFQLLLKTLKIFEVLDRDYEKFVRAFELKYISFLGYKPEVKKCILCNKDLIGKMKFSITNGGILCKECIEKGITGENITKEIQEILEFLLYSKLEELHDYKIKPENMIIIERILKNYLMTYIDKRDFKSLDFIKSIK
ncbi:DNA repair protein RecO [Thermohalobacter berrensis]|uniref:DNA repair protein RecO n=1 Tax=Thermohalobacter berrensis TaxID=99594 RepID=A0A419TB51_9FIRM|nr:DNA repair protein RecO [Thermohalobacter berrensis]RKD34724.1 DNA repair protein RecO [Thermohalobacter berrensis]